MNQLIFLLLLKVNIKMASIFITRTRRPVKTSFETGSNRFRNRCLPVFEDDRQNAEKCEDDQQSDRLKRQHLGR